MATSPPPSTGAQAPEPPAPQASMTTGIHEVKTNLSRLTKQARAGSRVVITNHGTPIADLEPHGMGTPPLCSIERPGPLPRWSDSKGKARQDSRQALSSSDLCVPVTPSRRERASACAKPRLTCLLATARGARCRYKRRMSVLLVGIKRSRFTLWDLLATVAAAGGWEGIAIGLQLEHPEVSALIALV